MTINRANQTWPKDVTVNVQKTAAQFWDDATPRVVRKLYSAAGLVFTEAALFAGTPFALLPAELKVAIYESDDFRNQESEMEFERRQRG
jgi:hypothetical protein